MYFLQAIASVHDKLLLFMRVVEIDMCFPFLVYFMAIEMSCFHEITSLVGTVLAVNTFLLCIAHAMDASNDAAKAKKTKLVAFAKLINVVCTIYGFLTILISDQSFDISEDIAEIMEVDTVDKTLNLVEF